MKELPANMKMSNVKAIVQNKFAICNKNLLFVKEN